MSCREHDDTIVDVARGVAGELEAAALLRHAEECPRCTLGLRRERALSAGLRALDAATPGEGASPGVEAALLAAFAAQQPSTTPVAGPSRARAWRPWLAAAAALVLVALGSLMVVRDGQAPQPGAPALLDARALPGAQPFDALAPAVEGRRASLVRADEAAVAVRPDSRGASAEEAPSAFVPWPGAAALPAFENGELVRTELPASVLPLLGIAGANRAAQATVVVDVVVGQDGYARAVRLAR